MVMTAGSRGDVQPYLALAGGLIKQGHDAALFASEDFESFAQRYHVPFYGARVNFDRMAQSDEFKEMRSNPLKAVKHKKDLVDPMLRSILDDAWSAAQDFQPDVIVYHIKAMAGTHIAEKLGIPVFVSLPVPGLTPTRAFPSPILPQMPLPNSLTHKLGLLTTLTYAGIAKAWRAEALKLPPRAKGDSDLVLHGQPVPVLYPFSEQIVPRPADWDDHIHVTGYWFLDQSSEWQPPADLLAFLNEGQRPVYVGFGSMSSDDQQKTTHIVVEALERSGRRGVVISGWGGIDISGLPDTIYAAESIPHDWLFPRVAAVVHHGGAGTTAAALRAGKPNIITPFYGDQPFWGIQVFERGFGTEPIPHKRLTAEKLAGAIQEALSDVAMCGCTEAVGAMIRSEDGVQRAIDIIEASV